MKVVACVAQKGGVGKSTLAAHLAGGLALRGHRVVLLDTDPQGDAALLLGMEPRDDLYTWLVEGAQLRDVVRAVPTAAYVPEGAATGGLLLLSSREKTPMIAQRVGDAYALADRVADLDLIADFVVMDTAPTLAPMDALVRLAVDGVLMVTEVEALSIAGLRNGLAGIDRMNEVRAGQGLDPVSVLGIVPNKVRGNTVSHRYQMRELKAEYGDLVWMPVMLRTVFTEASSLGELVFRYKAESYEVDEVNRLVDSLLEVV